MSNATQLLKQFTQAPESVHVDYLCFTFALKDLRHCYNAIAEKPKKGEPNYVKTKSLLQRCATAPKFPAPPVFNPTLATNVEDMHSYNNAFRVVYQNYLEDCLKIFTNRVLGLSLNAPRGLGFQFYTDSMKLTTPNGEDFCGYVGIGGNNDTVHFQINGVGCKHLFSQHEPWYVHDWLSNVLGVKQLARLDLAFDDYDGLFDCDYAYKAWLDDAFRTNARGRGPSLSPCHTIERLEDGNAKYSKEMYAIGSRTSRVYWRIYNKALEQNFGDTDLVWYRNEVELKKWDIDALLNPSGAFSGLNAFSASMCTSIQFNTKPKPSKRASLDLLSSAYWMRRQYGKILNSLITFHNGDVNKVIGSLVRDGTPFTFPDTYGKLVEHILEN
ncbi:replication initiation factor domain-containing protein [Vibrio kyushuensis]|uniref:replication initiation factor domain-containing protein n=1 Tax=Vibrio kyushuensis TaxID=2910249 RepID=UPI003D0B8EAD